MLQIFVVSVLAGFAVGFPAGPAGAICISYARRGELASALVGGVGAAVALGIWGAMAGYGLSALGGWVPTGGLRIAGGLSMLVIGVVLWRREPVVPAQTRSARARAVFTLTFAVVISIPTGLAWLVALMAAPLAGAPWSPWTSSGLVAGGVTVGTLLGYGAMMPVLSKVGEPVGDRLQAVVQRVVAVGVVAAGVAIVGFAVGGAW
jgi:threonine/homoserine/homoserine lactone efflux protein